MYPSSKRYYPTLQIRKLREAKSCSNVMRLVSSRTRSKCTFVFNRVLTEGGKIIFSINGTGTTGYLYEKREC